MKITIDTEHHQIAITQIVNAYAELVKAVDADFETALHFTEFDFTKALNLKLHELRKELLEAEYSAYLAANGLPEKRADALIEDLEWPRQGANTH